MSKRPQCLTVEAGWKKIREPANLITGWMWQAYSPQTPFFFGAGLAAAATLGMLFFIKE